MFVVPLCASIYLCLVVTCCERAGLLALIKISERCENTGEGIFFNNSLCEGRKHTGEVPKHR